EHPDTLFVALNHAMSLSRAGRLRQAQALFADTMPRALEVLGGKHPQYQLAMTVWGVTLEDAGDLAGAAARLGEALALREQALPPDAHQVVDTAWSLARVLRAAGRAAEADALHARLVAPLLAADPATLDPRQRVLREHIEEAIAEGEGPRAAAVAGRHGRPLTRRAGPPPPASPWRRAAGAWFRGGRCSRWRRARSLRQPGSRCRRSRRTATSQSRPAPATARS